MASMRCMRSALRNFNALRSPSNSVLPTHFYCKRQETTYAVKYTDSRRKAAYLLELYKRRLEVGPEKERHPSVYGCWNHDAEIYAFGQRLGEEFDEKVLKQAFLQESYVLKEKEKEKDLGLEVDFDMLDNTELSHKGRALASRYIKAYLRYSYPQLFEEGICVMHDYLMSDTTLLLVASNLGLRELIQSAHYPPGDDDYIRTFLAVIGAVAESQNDKRAEMFIADFILPQLIAKDVNELWAVHNPMGLLVAMLKAEGKGEPEPRLLWSSSKNTIMPLYHVGLYCDKKLIGKSPGESAVIAEEMAARDAIKNLLNTQDNRKPLVFGDKLREIELNYDKLNPSVKDLMT